MYIEPRLNEVWALREKGNTLAALNLCRNIKNSVKKDTEIFEEIICILENFERDMDNQERQVLTQFSLILSDKELE